MSPGERRETAAQAVAALRTATARYEDARLNEAIAGAAPRARTEADHGAGGRREPLAQSPQVRSTTRPSDA